MKRKLVKDLTVSEFNKIYNCDLFTATILNNKYGYIVKHMCTGLLNRAFSLILRDWYDFAATISGPPELILSALAYTLVEALRRLALKGTEWAEAQVDTIRLKLFKIGALVHISARRVWLELSSTYPWKQIYARAFDALRC